MQLEEPCCYIENVLKVQISLGEYSMIYSKTFRILIK